MVNAMFKVFSEGSLLGRFTLDAGVLDIGNRDVVLGPFGWKNMGFGWIHRPGA